ncbi:hypothetical protein EVJ58_g3853 [Rhodofomes roseus]|uniref:DNA 3'-5' helicase n=1 Tax=Rhodofomes roseus TaxID=34475 RepID=A0A4Y9YLG2_9APHY|nr:hypothetical protein EVJ58_g3853 [Rhodofomes roseus]
MPTGPASKYAWKLRKPTQKPQRLTQKPIPPPTRRVPLKPDQVAELCRLMKDAFQWSEGPREFQVEGVRSQIEGVDTIIQAPTGSGKTAIAAGPYVWPGNAMKTTIMVSPLLALEEEMVGTFKTEFGLPAVAVNGQIDAGILRGIFKDIVQGQYRIVLISPEMLQSPAFKFHVLRHQSFTQRVLSIVVDEAHCVSHWGADFRKLYGRLGTIRAHLLPGTPVIAVTATLTARVRRDLLEILHFPKLGGKFINVGNDRPNVSIVVRACEHPQNTLADLDFILPASINTPSDIPKTYVYVDKIETGNDIIDHLETLLRTRNPSLANHGLIRPFNATMSHEYRQAAMAAFRENTGLAPSDDSATQAHGPIRILVCTDAAGMGCNVPDIDLVVQWKLPAKLSNFIQRAGRAARGRGRRGLAVLIVERSAYSINIEVTTNGTQAKGRIQQATTGQASKKRRSKRTTKTTSQKGSKAPKGYAEQHGINRGNSTANADGPLNAEHQPALDPEAEDEEEWRAATLSRDYPQAIFGASALLDDATIDKLTSVGPLAEDEIKQILKEWVWRHDYETELCQLLRSLNVVFRPKPKPPKKTRAVHSADAATTPSAAGKRPAPRADDDPSDTMRPSTRTTKRVRLHDTGDPVSILPCSLDDALTARMVNKNPMDTSESSTINIMQPSHHTFTPAPTAGPSTAAGPSHLHTAAASLVSQAVRTLPLNSPYYTPIASPYMRAPALLPPISNPPATHLSRKPR